MDSIMEMKGFEKFRKGKKCFDVKNVISVRNSVTVKADHVKVSGELFENVNKYSYVDIYFNTDSERAIFIFKEHGDYKLNKSGATARFGGSSIVRNMLNLVGYFPVAEMLNTYSVMLKKRAGFMKKSS